MIEEEDKQSFRDQVYSTITFLITNNTVYESITGSSLSMRNFQFTSDTSRNIITNDILGTYCKTISKNSRLKDYKLIQDDDWGNYQMQSNGEYKTIGYVDLNKVEV